MPLTYPNTVATLQPGQPETIAFRFPPQPCTHEEDCLADEVARITPARCSAEDRGMNTSWAGGAPRKRAD